MDNNKLFFNINGIVPKNLHNITCNQSSKIINFKDGNSKIIPNLIIDSNDIIANHSAYIGEISEEELFYMKSRGINDIDIKKLVYKAVLLGKMDLGEEKEEFNKRINEWW
jgi:Fe-S cluster assembly scaffold protein SufB